MTNEAHLREIAFNTDERRKYETIWQFENYRTTSPAEVICTEIAERINDPRITDRAARIIDFGCGTGRVLDYFIDQGYDVLGVDIAHNCLDESMRNRIPLLIADLTRLPESVRGDLGICVDVLEHLPSSQVGPAIANIARAAPYGCFIRVANFPEGHGPRNIGEPLHLTLMDRGDWMAALLRGFSKVHALTLDADRAPERYSFWCTK